MDLLYLFAAAFGSGALYVGLAKFAGWQIVHADVLEPRGAGRPHFS